MALQAINFASKCVVFHMTELHEESANDYSQNIEQCKEVALSAGHEKLIALSERGPDLHQKRQEGYPFKGFETLSYGFYQMREFSYLLQSSRDALSHLPRLCHLQQQKHANNLLEPHIKSIHSLQERIGGLVGEIPSEYVSSKPIAVTKGIPLICQAIEYAVMCKFMDFIKGGLHFKKRSQLRKFHTDYIETALETFKVLAKKPKIQTKIQPNVSVIESYREQIAHQMEKLTLQQLLQKTEKLKRRDSLDLHTIIPSSIDRKTTPPPTKTRCCSPCSSEASKESRNTYLPWLFVSCTTRSKS
ncbi:MAG TPA: hypothetical protein VGJ00_07505 [Rhabdochlamydiaceae bacterium]|jgi:hypothetical protein